MAYVVTWAKFTPAIFLKFSTTAKPLAGHPAGVMSKSFGLR
jgi:hypothetical protein